MRKAVAYMIVAIAVLAAVTLYFGYSAGKTAVSRAVIGTLRMDLLRVDSAQRTFRARTGRFAASVEEMTGLTLSPTVQVAITSLSDSAYYAEARNPSWTGLCRVLNSPQDSVPEATCEGPIP